MEEEEASQESVVERYRKSKKRICRCCNQRLKSDLRNYHRECKSFCVRVDDVCSEIEKLRFEVTDLRNGGNVNDVQREQLGTKCLRIEEENSRLQRWCSQLGKERKRLQTILQELTK